jgi:hypothetical protein
MCQGALEQLRVDLYAEPVAQPCIGVPDQRVNQTSRTVRSLYVPQLGQAWCESFGSRQRGQAVREGAMAFQFARRERVLLRDIFRFGTATANSLPS